MTGRLSFVGALVLLACGSSPPPTTAATPPAADDGDPCAHKTPDECLPIAVDYARTGSAKANAPLAAKLLTRGCDANHVPSCVELSNLYLTGQGVPHDMEAWFGLKQKTCALKDADSCYFVARALNNGLLKITMGGEEPPPDFEQTAPQTRLDIQNYLQQACKLGHAESCDSLRTRSAADTMPWELPPEE
jgi:TPR repeat protein